MMDPLNNIIKELEALGQVELSNEMKAVIAFSASDNQELINKLLKYAEYLVGMIEKEQTPYEYRTDFDIYEEDEKEKERHTVWLKKAETVLKDLTEDSRKDFKTQF